MEWSTFRKHAPILANCTILLLGLLTTYIATQIPNPYTYAVAASTISGSLISLAFLRFRKFNIPNIPTQSQTLTKLSLIIYSLTVSFLFISFVPGQPRSLSVHIAQLVLYLLCAVVIFTGTQHSLYLGMMASTSLVHYLTLYWASAAQIGLDAQYHTRLINSLATVGSLEPLINSKYFYAPVQHLLVAIYEQLIASNTRLAGIVLVISVAFISTIGLYAIASRLIFPSVGLVAAYLFIVSDNLIIWSVRIGPTTLGYLLFIISFLSLVLIVSDYQKRYVLILFIIFVTQVLTHQVSALATAILLGTFLFGWMAYHADWSKARLAIRVSIWTGTALIISWLVTRRRGPAGDFPSFIAEMFANFYAQLQVTNGRPTPPTTGIALAGSDSLSIVQVSGFAILFCLAIIGAVYCLQLDRQRAAYSMGIGMTITGIGVVIFPAPVVGINFFLPSRWFVFFYIPLSIFAGVAIICIFSHISINLPKKGRIVATIVVILVLFAPYSIVMSLGYGAVDGPVIDDAPGASRLATTPQENGLYQHTAKYGVEETTTVGDHISRQLVERYYGHPTKYYQINDSTGELLYDNALLIDRSYAKTSHVSYLVHTNRSWRVYGPLPIKRYKMSKVFDNGDGALQYSAS